MERRRRALEKTGGVMSLFDSDDAPPQFLCEYKYRGRSSFGGNLLPISAISFRAV